MIPSSSSPSARIVLNDLWQALQDEDIRGDVTLVGRDQVEVSANRFVLAARSEMFKRMLYGSFQESSREQIPIPHYDGLILQAIVEFCHSNEISQFTVLYLSQHTELAGRRLVQLHQAADYFQIKGGLLQLVEGLVHNRTTRFPPLACAIYDEAPLNTPLSEDALFMIQCRPYVTLPVSEKEESGCGGGISCLDGTKLQTIFVDPNVKAGELFLFEMLQSWSVHKKRELREETKEGRKVNKDDEKMITSIVKECASHLHLEDIEPIDLVSVVQASRICSTSAITKAITCQALRASSQHIWSLSSRGKPNDLERILVEGAGSPDANGIYYYIDGLANGDLYSKREVACGQQYVYTLSISSSSTNDETECRIFCSKLLTHNGCQIIANNNHDDHDVLFQPMLQIIQVTDDDNDHYTLLQLSDGEHYLNAKIRNSERSQDLKPNTLIKVLKFTKYTTNGEEVAIHLKKISIVSLDPGHKFGNPVYYYDVFDVAEDHSPAEVVVVMEQDDNNPILLEREVTERLLLQQPPMSNKKEQPLWELYSCRFTSQEKPIHSKLPSPFTGWKLDSHGCAPVPRLTRWIPSASKLKNKALLDTTSPRMEQGIAEK